MLELQTCTAALSFSLKACEYSTSQICWLHVTAKSQIDRAIGWLHPLPLGEGWGEGSTASLSGAINNARCLSPRRESRLAILVNPFTALFQLSLYCIKAYRHPHLFFHQTLLSSGDRRDAPAHWTARQEKSPSGTDESLRRTMLIWQSPSTLKPTCSPRPDSYNLHFSLFLLFSQRRKVVMILLLLNWHHYIFIFRCEPGGLAREHLFMLLTLQ